MTVSQQNTVAIIGSFRQHYESVCRARDAFASAGITVTTPLGATVLDPTREFVRFASDDSRFNDAQVQTLALHRILRARAVYVVAPGGYVGRTTTYEIGRAIQAGRPLYFSERPLDLPIAVPDGHVLPAEELSTRIMDAREEPLVRAGLDDQADLEWRLLTGEYSSE